MFVDDEKDLCAYLKDFFGRIGFQVFIATNGQEALAVVKKEKPKVIFLDIRMLGMSGLEVLKEIKKLDQHAKVNIVSVQDDEQTKEEAKKLGADEFIRKPFVSDYLREVVRRQVAELLPEER